jgi:phosphohistidine phosphatase
MKLFLVQHGEAKPDTEDPGRSLTLKGEDEVQRVASVAQKMGLAPTKIFHSGKHRSRQTADIFGEALKQLAEAAPGLNPNDDIRPWADRIARERGDLLLVGHLPFLEKLTSFLLVGDENARLVRFRYGAIVCLEPKEDGKWAIRWLLSPEMASECFSGRDRAPVHL